MLPGKFIPVIRILSEQCDQLGITWAFTGSLNLLLWGFDLQPQDIDLETDRFGAEQIDQLYASKVLWALHLRDSEIMQSWFGRYDFEGVQVEVMGDCHYRQPDGGWIIPRPLEDRIRRRTWEGLNLPLLELKDEMEICCWMGRPEKAERIRAWLVEHPTTHEDRLDLQ